MIRSMPEAEKYLQQFISQNKDLRFPGKIGLERTAYFLNLLKNPQEKLKVIHIAGTSGKGSTAFYISVILNGLGFKTGLHISPYLIDFRERFQINTSLISQKKFCQYLNDILPAIKKVGQSRFREPSYFEILTVLAFYIFWKEKVDYAVMETGLGGTFDATNTVKNRNKLCVLTKIGHDHTRILGKTLNKIAIQKAGIIQEGNRVISVWQNESIRKIFEKKVSQVKGELEYVKKGTAFKNIWLKNNKIFFDFFYKGYGLKNIQLNTPAHYQAENCALALSTVLRLSQKDKFPITENNIKEVLKAKSLLGRMEIKNINTKTVVLDGAHNPQKMKCFLESLQKIYPKKKFSFLISFKRKKDYAKMLKYIIPKANQIIISAFRVIGQDLIHTSEDPTKIAINLAKQKFSNYKIVPDAKEALKELLKKSSDIKVITGSIYLLGKIYPLISKKRDKN